MSGSITKTIRIRAVDLPKIESVMSEKGLTWSGAVHYLLSNETENSDRELERYRKKFSVLSTRVRQEADKYFKNEQYTMLEIVPVGYKGVNTTSESVNTDKFVELSEDLRMPYDVMYSEIKRLTDSGELMKEGIGFAVHEHGLDIKEFLKVCKDAGKDAQKCLNGFTNSLRNGNRST